MSDPDFARTFTLASIATYPLMTFPAVAAWRRHSDKSGHWWIAGGLLVGLVSNLVQSALRMSGIPNHVVWSWLAVPMTACLLLGIAEFQVTAVERLATRLAIPLFAVGWVALALWVEQLPYFKPWRGPFFSLTLLGIAGWAWVRQAVTSRLEPIWRQDWFWILGGLALYGAITAPASPLAAYLVERGEGVMVLRLWLVRNLLLIVAYLLITWGILCHRPLRHSGSSSSPAPSS